MSAENETKKQEETERSLPGTGLVSTLRWVMLGAALLGAGFSIALAVGGGGGFGQAQVRYHCPMHPTVVSDRPGSCPICGMDLVPIKEGETTAVDAHDHHHGHDEIDMEALAVEVAEALGAKPGQWVCPMVEDEVVSDEPGTCDKCGMALVQVPEEKEPRPSGPTLYTCPMHPEVQHEGPGKCPKCGMYLVSSLRVPGEGGGVSGLAEVTIPSDRVERLGVRTALAEKGRLGGQVRTVGVVTADEGRRYVVQARFSGWIEELLVDETGKEVEKGQPLLRIYGPELYAAQLEYLDALKWRPELRQAAEQRLTLMGIASADLANLRRTGKPQRSMVLRAPGSGYVLRKEAVAGAYVSPGTVLFEVADLSKVWVLADVFEQEIPRVRAGLGATFAAPARPSDRFLGEVTFVYPTVEPSTRTMKVRLEIPNEGTLLRPGMFGDVRLEVESPEGILVPRDAVIDSGDHVYAIVARGGGRFAPREVHVTGRAGEHVMVIGLEEGEKVVTSAGFFIDAESRLRAALSGLGGGGHDHGGSP